MPVDREAGHSLAATPDPKMLEMLVCPLTRTALHYDRESNELVSRAARLAFPVRDGIPIMLASEARQLGEDELPPA
jgi:uncharacterized protein YbaR (Trm112 family)